MQHKSQYLLEFRYFYLRMLEFQDNWSLDGVTSALVQSKARFPKKKTNKLSKNVKGSVVRWNEFLNLTEFVKFKTVLNCLKKSTELKKNAEFDQRSKSRYLSNTSYIVDNIEKK